MKRIGIFLAFGWVLAACAPKAIDKEQVFKLLEQTGKYPYVHAYGVYYKDSEDGRKAIDVGLEKEGYVKVERNRKSGDNTGPVITFTDLAKPFLMEPDKGQLSSVQKVSLAKEVLDEVQEVQLDMEKGVGKARYTTKFIAVSPFAKFAKKDFTEKKQHEAMLVLHKNTWELSK